MNVLHDVGAGETSSMSSLSPVGPLSQSAGATAEKVELTDGQQREAG